MDKITPKDLQRAISDPNIPLEESLRYLHLEFDGTQGVKVDVDESLLDLTKENDTETVGANVMFKWIVEAIRTRRKREFFNCLDDRAKQDRKIVLLDGDSWAQHPLVDEIYDHLTKDYNVYCGSLAGRLMEELRKERQYETMLEDISDHNRLSLVQALVLSGGGNDLFGPAFNRILKKFNSAKPDDAAAHVDQKPFDELLQSMSTFYSEVITHVRSLHGDLNFPIVLHSYAYLTPWDKDGGFPPKDKWMGDPMRAKGIVDIKLQKAIIVHMLDQFHDMLEAVRSKHHNDNIKVLDNRAALPGDRKWWSDEIHPSSKGFNIIVNSIRSSIVGT